ncbi:MAG: EAL domain-containing protein [Betaproteobacteria bacterium]|nr:EAL domain-containing protein [Betaproteobacteria bacterium]
MMGWRNHGLDRFRFASLRAELAAGFAAMVALMIVVGMVSLFAQDRSVGAVKKLLARDGRIAELSVRSKVAMVNARRAEKDFLLFQREFGFDEARSRYVTLLRTNLADIRQNMTEVRALGVDPGLDRETVEIEHAVARYEAGFFRLVELYGRLGNVKTGDEGLMREKAHEIESLVNGGKSDRLMADLLMLRRHEKDFIARGLEKYVEAFTGGVEKLRADLAVAHLAPETTARLGALTSEYLDLFEQYVQTDTKIDAERASYIAAAHAVEPLLERLFFEASEAAVATRNDAERVAKLAAWFISGAGLLAVLLGSAVARLVARSITRSVDACVDFASQVAKGDLTIRLASQAQNEFGALASALNRMTDALLEREAGLRRAQLVASLAHVVSGPDGSFESWSDNLPALIGVESSRMPRSTREWLEIVHPEDRAMFRAKAIEGGVKRARMDVGYRLRRAEDEWIHIDQVMEPLSGAAGPDGRMRWFNTLQDVTQRKAVENTIGRLNRVYAVLSGINALIVRVRDRDELFKEACRVAVEIGGFPMAWLGVVDRAEMRVKPVAWHGAGKGYIERMELSLDDAGSAVRGLVRQSVKERKAMMSNDLTQDPRLSLQREALDHGFRSRVVLPLVVNEEVAGVLALYAGEAGFFDEDEMKLLNELAGDIAFALEHIEKANQLDYLAYHDPLTGLANRVLFLERVNQHVRVAGPADSKIAVVLADIERLRTINESLGRQAGDAVIKEFARRLAHAADPAALGRVSADHFAIILQAVKGKSEVARRFEAIWRDCLSAPFVLEARELWITAKAGIALYPNDAADSETLLRHAEAALRKGRELGERYLFYTPVLTERTGEKLTLENQLRQALEKEEFVLHYQPKVDAETQRIVGVEALIRWQSPELGLVPPMKFIPLMEQTGLILPVGTWALRRASLDHRRWLEQKLAAPRVAVNVSPIQLRQRDFVHAVEEAIMEGLAPTGIDLEITESLVMEDVQGNIEKLKSVRQLGVKIAIDDFGTGYSSLGCLARLPVQSLKIDRSFVITMVDDPDTMTLVSTIISLAHSLRLKVVAEGVDAEEQAKFLRLLRCDEMQGYLFSRPVPFEQMTAMLTR